jgi:hypothetical protein
MGWAVIIKGFSGEVEVFEGLLLIEDRGRGKRVVAEQGPTFKSSLFTR